MSTISMIKPDTRETCEVPAHREQEFYRKGFVIHEKEEVPKINPADLKKAEVIEELTKRGIKHDQKESVDHLRGLLQAALDTPADDNKEN